MVPAPAAIAPAEPCYLKRVLRLVVAELAPVLLKRYQRIAVASTQLLQLCIDADLLYPPESKWGADLSIDEGIEEDNVPF